MSDAIPLAVSIDALRQLCLVKQHLTPISQTSDLVGTVKSMGGLHGQLPKTVYLSLFNRIPDFKNAELNQAMYVDKTLVRIKSIRQTLYIFPRDMIGTLFSATSSLMEKPSARYLESLGITEEIHGAIVSDILGQMARASDGAGGLATKDLKQGLALSEPLAQLISLEKGASLVSAVVNTMCDSCLLIRGESTGGWKSNLYNYYPAAAYLPEVDFGATDEATARTQVILMYIQAFGPVTEADICWWTGFTKTSTREALKQLESEVVKATLGELEGSFYMTPADVALLTGLAAQGRATDAKTVVNLLPVLDPLLMGYKIRARFLDPDFAQFVYDGGGNATSTILVDGRVAGVWDFVSEPRDHVRFFLFEAVDAETLGLIRAKAVEVARFLMAASKPSTEEEASAVPVEVIQCFEMKPLKQLSAGSFQSPLKSARVIGG